MSSDNRKIGGSVLLDQTNNFHPNIKLTLEVNATKFLDTKLTNINSAYKFNFYCKNTKLYSPWTCKSPKRYKQNTVSTGLHPPKNIIKFWQRSRSDKKKVYEGHPLHLINSAVNRFQKGSKCGNESFIAPPSWNYKTFHIHWNTLLWTQWN